MAAAVRERALTERMRSSFQERAVRAETKKISFIAVNRGLGEFVKVPDWLKMNQLNQYGIMLVLKLDYS